MKVYLILNAMSCVNLFLNFFLTINLDLVFTLVIWIDLVVKFVIGATGARTLSMNIKLNKLSQ